MAELKTPHEWCEQYKVMVLDSDGWVVSIRGFGGPKPWSEPITLAEFQRRAALSTANHGVPGWRAISDDLRDSPAPSL